MALCACGEAAIVELGTPLCVGHALITLARLAVEKRPKLSPQLQDELVTLRRERGEMQEQLAAAESEKAAALARAGAADQRRQFLDVTIAQLQAALQGQAMQLAVVLGHPANEKPPEWTDMMAEVSEMVHAQLEAEIAKHAEAPAPEARRPNLAQRFRERTGIGLKPRSDP